LTFNAEAHLLAERRLAGAQPRDPILKSTLQSPMKLGPVEDNVGTPALFHDRISRHRSLDQPAASGLCVVYQAIAYGLAKAVALCISPSKSRTA